MLLILWAAHALDNLEHGKVVQCTPAVENCERLPAVLQRRRRLAVVIVSSPVLKEATQR